MTARKPIRSPIKDIATAAGINKALIYYHFKNKKDIVDSLFQHTIEEMFAMQGNAEEKIRDAGGLTIRKREGIISRIAVFRK
ncbi:MAG: helix-turn-helix transcriptional regulator [Chitinispirillaceae bacterium]|nr:helix-turn-helix transcriptional regulator [Chitinispirillaceae bacterium]